MVILNEFEKNTSKNTTELFEAVKLFCINNGFDETIAIDKALAVVNKYKIVTILGYGIKDIDKFFIASKSLES